MQSHDEYAEMKLMRFCSDHCSYVKLCYRIHDKAQHFLEHCRLCDRNNEPLSWMYDTKDGGVVAEDQIEAAPAVL